MRDSAYQKTELSDGLKIISESMSTVRSISIGLWVDIGSRDEPAALGGVSHFIEHMVFKGTTTRSPLEIVSHIESVGGVLNAFTSRENTCFLAKVIDEHLPRAVEILADLVFSARFDKSDITKEMKIVVDEINEVKDTPSDLVHDIFARSIFGTHPLGRPILGSPRTVRGLSRSKIIDFLHGNYRRDRMLIVASGNLKHKNLVELINKYLPQSAENHRRAIIRARPKLRSGLFVSSRDTTQTHICIGTPAMKFDHPQRGPLLLLNSILGGGMSSRLFQKVREELGLAYTVFSYIDFFKDASVIGVYLSTDKKQTGLVISIIMKELEKLRNENLPAAELKSAKEQLKGSLVLGLENTSHRMNRLAKHELLLDKYISIDESIAEIDAITGTQVRDIAARLFRPGRFTFTVLGPVTKKFVESSLDFRS